MGILKPQSFSASDSDLSLELNEHNLRRLQSQKIPSEKTLKNEQSKARKGMVAVSSNSTDITQGSSQKPQKFDPKRSEKSITKTDNSSFKDQSHSLVYLFITSFILRGFSMKQIVMMLLYLIVGIYVKRTLNKISNHINRLIKQ